MTATGDRPWRVALSETTLGPEEIAAVTGVMASGWLSAGPVTREFERDFASAIGAPDAVAVSSGTAALHLALLALGVGPGDEVIVPALSFVAAAAMTVAVGAVPVFADVCSTDDLTVDPGDVARRITSKTRALVAMHYAGYAADLGRLHVLAAASGLALIEDAAHAPIVAHGGQPRTGMLGTIGHVGCFSFHPAKNLTTGEGGMVVSADADADVLARCRAMRSHHMTPRAVPPSGGEPESYDVDGLGFNYRPTEIGSAIGRVQLRKLSSDRRIRSALVARYRDALAGAPGLLMPFTGRQGIASAHHLFAVVLPAEADRSGFRAALREAGVQTSVHYPPTHLMSYYRRRAAGTRLPVCEELAGRLVSLPLHARMSEADVDYVAAVVIKALHRARRR